MEIIGEYVRTHLGNIHKIVMYDEENEKYITDTLKCFDEVAVFKHSKNIIDLIEVRRLRKWNISNRERKHFTLYRYKRNRQKWLSYTN